MSNKVYVFRAGSDVLDSSEERRIFIRSAGGDVSAFYYYPRKLHVMNASGDVASVQEKSKIDVRDVGVDVLWTVYKPIELLYCKLGHNRSNDLNLMGITFDTYGNVNVGRTLTIDGSFVGNMRTEVYDNDRDGYVDAVPWSNLLDVPTEFVPTFHTHWTDDVFKLDGLQDGDIFIYDAENSAIVSGGQFSFVNLKDTPNTFSGHKGKFVRVDSSETMLVFSDAAAGGGDVDILMVQVFT